MTLETRDSLLLTISNFVCWPLMPGCSPSAFSYIDTHRQQRAKDAIRRLEADPDSVDPCARVPEPK